MKLFAGVALAILVGCGSSSGGGGDGGPVTGDGAVQPTTDGAVQPGTDGAVPPAGDAAPPADGASAADGAPPATGDGATAMLDDSGKPALGGMDGITGVTMGMTYTFTTSAKVTDYGTGFQTLLLEARAATGGDAWTITIPKMPGVYPCGKIGQMNDGTFALLVGPKSANAQGVPGSSCTIEVKSTVGHIEGRFVAVLSGFAGMTFPVTSGYFYFSNGLADCSTAKDPGVPDGMNGATLSVTKLVGTSSTYTCGENVVLKPQTSNMYEPLINFTGMTKIRPITLQIDGLYGVGTFPCGMPGSTTAMNAKAVSVDLGFFKYMDGGYGSCSVTVTKFDTIIEGSYSGTLWDSASSMHNEMTVTGHFRIPAKFP